jgi:hypothetical protein
MTVETVPTSLQNLNEIHYNPGPVRIRDITHPLACRKRRRNGAVLRMRPEKPRSLVTADVAR